MSKTKVFSIILQKGGVGKSTLTFSLGAELAKKGYKVLLLDLDPSQGSLSQLAHIDDADDRPGLADVMLSYTNNEKNKIEIKDVITPITENLDICTVSIRLNGIDLQLSNVISRETCLKRELASTVEKDYYDFILIDNQPSLSLLPVNSLVASDYVIIPCALSYLSYRGLDLLKDTLDIVRDNLNNKLKIYGVIGTFKQHTNHSKEIEELIIKNEKFIASIPHSVVAQDFVYSFTDVTTYAPKSKVAKAYSNIADRLISDYEKSLI